MIIVLVCQNNFHIHGICGVWSPLQGIKEPFSQAAAFKPAIYPAVSICFSQDSGEWLEEKKRLFTYPIYLTIICDLFFFSSLCFQQMDSVVHESYKTIQEVTKNLDGKKKRNCLHKIKKIKIKKSDYNVLDLQILELNWDQKSSNASEELWIRR